MTVFQRYSVGFLGALVVLGVVLAAFRPPAATTGVPVANLAADSPMTLVMEPAVAAPGAAPNGGLFLLANLNSRLSAHGLWNAFREIGYDLKDVKSGRVTVPRLFLSTIPQDMADVTEVTKRKSVFFKSVLPLILQVNEEIVERRRRIWNLRYMQRMGEALGAADRLWLMVMKERYDVPDGDLDMLLRRVDVIPPSLALAQAAEESGWGTSRFVREGNALFGQWVFSKKRHMVPEQRDNGKRHRIKAFDSLIDGVRAYAFNLNTHRAYGEFRMRRQERRRLGTPLDGFRLAGTLRKYSERGKDYIRSVRIIISVNNLRELDGARLRDRRRQAIPSI